MSRIWRDPGVTVRSSSAGSERPRRTAATIARSSYDELTELPTQTCRVGVPGHLADGNDVARATRAARSAARAPPGRSSPPRRRRRPGRRRARPIRPRGPARRASCRVCSSLGKMPDRRAGLHHHVADRPAVGRAQRRDPVAVELEDAAAPAADVPAPQQLEHDVLRLHPRAQPAAELDADDDAAARRRTAAPPSRPPPRSHRRRSRASRARPPWSCGCPRRRAPARADRSARGGGSARCRCRAASSAAP